MEEEEPRKQETTDTQPQVTAAAQELVMATAQELVTVAVKVAKWIAAHQKMVTAAAQLDQDKVAA